MKKSTSIEKMRQRKRAMQLRGYLREFEGNFEYRFILNYEFKFDGYILHTIPVGDIFVNLIELEERTILVSLLFKQTNDIDEVYDWLDTYSVNFDDDDSDSNYVTNAHSIKAGACFHGIPIIVVAPGTNIIDYEPDLLREMADSSLHEKRRLRKKI